MPYSDEPTPTDDAVLRHMHTAVDTILVAKWRICGGSFRKH